MGAHYELGTLLGPKKTACLHSLRSTRGQPILPLLGFAS